MGYVITLRLDAFDGRQDRLDWPEDVGLFIGALAEFNAETLRQRPDIPPLYESGVRYRPEPNRGPDVWKDIVATLNDGHGDCEDLAAWRLAELEVRDGVHAVPAITHVERDGVVDLHIALELPGGQIEDPAALLGM